MACRVWQVRALESQTLSNEKKQQHTATRPLLKRRENPRTEQKQFGFNLENGFGEDKSSGNLYVARIEWFGAG